MGGWRQEGVPPENSLRANGASSQKAVRRLIEQHSVHFTSRGRFLNLLSPCLILGAVIVWFVTLIVGVVYWRKHLVPDIHAAGDLYLLWIGLSFAVLLITLAVQIVMSRGPKTLSDWGLVRLALASAILPTVLVGLLFAALLWVVTWIAPQKLGESFSNYDKGYLTLASLGYPLFPARARRRLEGLRAPSENDNTPFLLLRRFHRVPMLWFRDPEIVAESRSKRWARDRWNFLHFLNAWAVASVFDMLGVVLARKFGAGVEQFYRDYVASPQRQKTFYTDGKDMALRYRQSAAELELSATDPSAERCVPKFIALSCLANPMKEAVWIMPVEVILREMATVLAESEGIKDPAICASQMEKIYKVLEDRHFIKFDRHRMIDPQPTGGTSYFIRPTYEKRGCAIGQGLAVEKLWAAELAIDQNRVEVRDEPDETYVRDTKRPLAILIRAIRQADDKGQAIPVLMKRGDLLLVDNRRALICRKEYRQPRFIFLRIRFRTKHWFRIYYGFPRPAG